jgi:hypothetical protein
MLTLQGAAKLPANTPKTGQELIAAVIAARSYATAQQQNEAARRWRAAVKCEGYIEPQGNVYMMDSYRNVHNGVAATTGWTLPDDFNAEPGGGVVLQGGVSRHFKFTTSLGGRVFYAAADTVIYFDLVAE